MRNTLLFIFGWLLIVLPELLRIYFIMPFPGSQADETISFAYFLHRYIFFFLVAGVLMIVFPLFHYMIHGKWFQKIASIFFAAVAMIVFLMTTRVMQADKMFLQPRHKIITASVANSVSLDRLVIGVAINGDACCYPIQIIGYHHQVRDTVGGTPLIATYCTVCRTGRVYSPYINGQLQHFRLVGMDHFNAMLEDETSKSWWRQENGEAIAGPMKGKYLDEIPSEQMTLKAWLREYPKSRILQPDPEFRNEYASLEGFDNGTLQGNLEGTAHASWQLKSWVVGIKKGNAYRAYDWLELKKYAPVNDTLDNSPILLVVENDSMTFHAWSRTVNGESLHFHQNDSLQFLIDDQTSSRWNYMGECIAGPITGQKLSPIPAYQEFWHSWQTFHPNTTVYKR